MRAATVLAQLRQMSRYEGRGARERRAERERERERLIREENEKEEAGQRAMEMGVSIIFDIESGDA